MNTQKHLNELATLNQTTVRFSDCEVVFFRTVKIDPTTLRKKVTTDFLCHTPFNQMIKKQITLFCTEIKRFFSQRQATSLLYHRAEEVYHFSFVQTKRGCWTDTDLNHLLSLRSSNVCRINGIFTISQLLNKNDISNLRKSTPHTTKELFDAIKKFA